MPTNNQSIFYNVITKFLACKFGQGDGPFTPFSIMAVTQEDIMAVTQEDIMEKQCIDRTQRHTLTFPFPTFTQSWSFFSNKIFKISFNCVMSKSETLILFFNVQLNSPTSQKYTRFDPCVHIHGRQRVKTRQQILHNLNLTDTMNVQVYQIINPFPDSTKSSYFLCD